MSDVPHSIVCEARKEHFLRGMIRTRDIRVALVCDGKAVGFYTPRVAKDGLFRVGPVYIIPEFRKRGLLRSLYESMPIALKACIEHGNVASEAAHERCGFVRWRRYSNGWWWYRDARANPHA